MSTTDPKRLKSDVSVSAPTGSKQPPTAYLGKGGRKLALIPTPSDHPQDPLASNWTSLKKSWTLGIVCFGSFAASSAAVTHLTAYPSIARTYHRTPNELTYSVSTALGGQLVGPFLLAPLTKVFGRTAVIFWCLLATIATQIWSAVLTDPGDYVNMLVSRLFAGIFSSLPTIVGSGYIMDTCFLHQRGLAFAFYELSLLLGVIAPPTIGGFIVESNPWPLVFWWTLGPLGLAAVLFATLIDDTEYAPGRSLEFTASPSDSYLVRRAQFLTGLNTTAPISARRLLGCYATPWVIGIAPITICAGFYNFVNFGWAILVSSELAIFLQTPRAEGGYSFSPSQNAAFTFTSWVALLTAQVFGAFYNDRVPIWLSLRRKRNRGQWHPEDRLWSILIGPAILLPIGLALIGVTLQYQLHYMILAVGWYIFNFAVLLSVPVCLNYVIERFTGSAVEVSVAMGAYRLALGLSILFYFAEWKQAVGVGWLFGMAAFFSIFATGVLALLAWQGQRLQKFVLLKSLLKSEAGRKLTVE